ncbi:hypothetical protein VNO78_08533 [Psophocarpus tetragonolobus]|uniref:Uncharacterized protein n=1 Tax=Psophocarpus tetragonolobus TaxID=3891 RepID=A0AAN9XSP6_PSOTE
MVTMEFGCLKEPNIWQSCRDWAMLHWWKKVNCSSGKGLYGLGFITTSKHSSFGCCTTLGGSRFGQSNQVIWRGGGLGFRGAGMRDLKLGEGLVEDKNGIFSEGKESAQIEEVGSEG